MLNAPPPIFVTVVGIVTLFRLLQLKKRSAFFGCSSLKSVTIPKGITEIKDWTFYDFVRSIKYPQ